MNFHSLFLTIGVLTVAATLVSLRREHIRTEYSISWLGLGIMLTLLALFPRAVDGIARRVDLDSRLLFIILGGALVSSLVFEISHVVSRLRDENVMLAQRLAILEYQFHQNRQDHGQEIIDQNPNS